MKKYGIMVTNGSYRLYESDSGEVFKVEDVLISNNKHLDFTNELLEEKDKQIEDLLANLTIEVNGSKMPVDTCEIIKFMNGHSKVKITYHDAPGYCKEEEND